MRAEREWARPASPIACAVAVLPLLFASSPALAKPSSDPSEPIRITYAAAPACPTQDEFVGYVRRYTTKWRLASDGSATRAFHVALTSRSSDATVGRVELVGSDGLPREIVGPDCEAVARALAIALAVMIDPEADLSGHAEEPLPMDPPAPEPRGIDEVPPQPAPRAAERRRHPVVNVPPKQRATPIVTIEGSATATTAIVGGLLPVLGATVELAPSSRPLARWLRPSVAVGVRQSLPRDLDTSGFVTEFLWSAGVLRLCPVHFTAIGDRLELIPCFETNAGVLRANARSSVAAPTSTRPWLDFGGSARVTYRIGRTWFAGASFAVVVPYTRYRFELSDRASVSQAPPTGVTFGGCAGVRF